MQEKIINMEEEKPLPKKKKNYLSLLCSIFKISYYQKYFAVTTSSVIKKIIYSLTIINYKKFKKVSKNKIDYYGPFWIYITMVFSLSISQNLYSLLSKPKNRHFKYTIKYLPNSFSIILLFGFFIPIFFNTIIRAFGGFIDYNKIITIYGYSQSINIFVLFFSAYPNGFYQSLLIFYGAAHSFVFIFLCLKEELLDKEGDVRNFGVGCLSFCQLLLVLVYKQYFFRDLYNVEENYY